MIKMVARVAWISLGVALVGCGGGVDATEDGEETSASGSGGSGGGDVGPAAGPTVGSGSGAGTSSGTGSGAGTSSGSGSGTGTSSTGSGGGATACADDDEGVEVVACGFPPNIAVLGADDTSAYVLALGASSTFRTYRIDLASGTKFELYHDLFSGSDPVSRARNYLAMDGSLFAVLNLSGNGTVNTGIVRFDDGGPETILPFGATGYTRLVGASGRLYFEGGQGLSGLFSIETSGGQPTPWIEHEGCDSCVLSGGLVGAAPSDEIGVTAHYVAGGQLYRLPDTEYPLGDVPDGMTREATVSPTADGETYVSVDAGFGGMHRIDRILRVGGERMPLVEVSDVEGYGPPRFLEARGAGEGAEVLYVQTNDRYGSIARVDGITGEELPLPDGPAWGEAPIRAAGAWVYFTKTRGGEDGPVEGALLRARLD